MAMSLTFPHTDPGLQRSAGALAGLAVALLVAVAAPASACEKGSATLVARASAETRTMGAFTREIVNGTPVYRLPSITVIGRRDADVATAQRDEDSVRNRRSRTHAAVLVPAPTPHVETASRDVREASRCVG